jgi:hypothetical protein
MRGMEVFDCGSREVVLQRLRAFVEEMDDAGEAYGYATGESDDDPIELTADGGIMVRPDSDAPHAILLVGGEAEVTGAGGGSRRAQAGQGVLWQPGEDWTLSVYGESVQFFQVESPSLRLDHFAIER